ncbi:hypothetical protein FOZ63_023515, partial [Perkinsus olseni]
TTPLRVCRAYTMSLPTSAKSSPTIMPVSSEYPARSFIFTVVMDAIIAPMFREIGRGCKKFNCSQGCCMTISAGHITCLQGVSTALRVCQRWTMSLYPVARPSD